MTNKPEGISTPQGAKVVVKCKGCKCEFSARVADMKRGWGNTSQNHARQLFRKNAPANMPISSIVKTQILTAAIVTATADFTPTDSITPNTRIMEISMAQKIEGISAETVEATSEAIKQSLDEYMMSSLSLKETRNKCAQAAITALLTSGEVVLRKDVEELVGAITEYRVARDNNVIRYSDKEMEERQARFDLAEKLLNEALRKFTTKPSEGVK